MPFGWDESADAYNQAQSGDVNQASFGAEALSGAGAFGAMKVFEDHQKKEGKPVSHQFAKELLAGFAGVEVDRLAQTTGADWVDREEAKRSAKDNVEHMYDQQYAGQGDQYDPNTVQHNDQFNNNNY